MSKSLKDKILKSLIDTHHISQDDVNASIALQKKKNITLERAFIEKGLINEQDFLMLLVRELGIPFINLAKYKIDPVLKEIIPEHIARKYQIIPLSSLDYTMTIAMSDPLNVFVLDDLKHITGKEIDVVMSTQAEIMKTINQFYTGQSVEAAVTDISKDMEVAGLEIVGQAEDQEGDIDNALDESKKAPIIRMVNLVIKEALKQRASDIHIEPAVDAMRVRYRIDGILQNILEIPKESQNAVTVRIKIMSRLDITVNHTPQDGRFTLKLSGREIDFRVSILPTTFGQKIVMRVLDKSNLQVGLDGLGFEPGALAILKESIRKPFGMLLVTGPTGSGKSTTLYSIITELNSIEKNIITVEDPVEYQIDGLTQIQARPEIGLTFAEGLRSILRQSPDIVMVGEIRDNETADIAIKASLTGQLVLSTLHTNDAAGALTRLVDMGVEPFLVASSLVMVSAQRLCRRICTSCKATIQIPDDVFKRVGYNPKPGAVFYQGKGCNACQHTGYRGRMGITEILDIDDEIRRLLLEGKSSDDIKNYAREKKKMRTLWDDAMEKCLRGMTTLEEVLRITSNE